MNLKVDSCINLKALFYMHKSTELLNCIVGDIKLYYRYYQIVFRHQQITDYVLGATKLQLRCYQIKIEKK